MVLSDLDRDLLNRCLSGADGAWENFIDRYIALITHVVNSTSKIKYSELPSEVRDDMVAEILLALVDDDFAILRRFRGQSSLGTYLVVVTRRIASRRLAKLGALAPERALVAGDRTHAAGDMNMENAEEVQVLLQQLPEEEAVAIRMFHLEHRSYGDIGSHIGIPENSVGPLLSRARDRMRGMRSR